MLRLLSGVALALLIGLLGTGFVFAVTVTQQLLLGGC